MSKATFSLLAHTLQQQQAQLLREERSLPSCQYILLKEPHAKNMKTILRGSHQSLLTVGPPPPLCSRHHDIAPTYCQLFRYMKHTCQSKKSSFWRSSVSSSSSLEQQPQHWCIRCKMEK
ncbi:hypothetical protein CEXT_321341 [Caerostris extrusa]|uniref:Uncharacterized protein n=1 Tax=Caerostris extrusa TaxID=172846 RepID=A0AAV4UAU6_CAEEX|nr:hypothetical protein CEXT_321341 [Caerostris extrusa]